MFENIVAIGLAAGIGIAALVYGRRSRSYIALTLLIGAIAVMIADAITDASTRYLALVMVIVGSIASYRGYCRMKAEHPSTHGHP